MQMTPSATFIESGDVQDDEDLSLGDSEPEEVADEDLYRLLEQTAETRQRVRHPRAQAEDDLDAYDQLAPEDERAEVNDVESDESELTTRAARRSWWTIPPPSPSEDGTRRMSQAWSRA